VSALQKLNNVALRELGRLPYPFVRRKGEKGFRRVSWEEVHTRLGARLRETMPTGISPVSEAALKAGRLAQGVEVTLADGQTLPFGPSK